MNKKLNYFVQYLCTCKETPFVVLCDFLFQKEIVTPLVKDSKIIRINAAKEGIKVEQSSGAVLKQLDELLKEEIEKEIQDTKNKLFETLIKSNFKKKKEEFDKVETSIYKCLNAYVFTLCRTLEVFYCYGINKQKDPEVFVEFGKKMHSTILENIFNKEERDAIDEQLNLLLSVYLAMYSKYIYK